MFYHHKDDELQKLLFGEVLYKYNQYPKTTIPFKFFFPNVDSNIWIFHNVAFNLSNIYSLNKFDEYNEIMDELK